jgi:hypothetical protein
LSGSKKRRQKLHQKLAGHGHRKVPHVPKHYFLRPHIPPPTYYKGKAENKKHYDYKIFIGETLRDRLPYIDINYEYLELPTFYHERYNRYLSYTPDIFISYHDDEFKRSYYCDLEINGLIHYKNKDQILKVKERKDHIYPYLQTKKEPNKEDYSTVASYIIIEVDDFEYETITDLYHLVKTRVFEGGQHPLDLDKILFGYLKVAA